MQKTTTKTKAIQILTIAFVILLICIIAIANAGLGSAVFAFLDYIPGGDKTGHFLLIGLLSLLVNLRMGAKTTTLKSVTVLKGSLTVTILVIAEELSQLFLKYRAFDLVDLIFDAAGIFVFGRLAKWLVKVI
jgi:hypothetical protein